MANEMKEMFNQMEIFSNEKKDERRSHRRFKWNEDVLFLLRTVEQTSLIKYSFSLLFSSSRPGRPPKRNSSHPLDECLEDKRMKLSSSLLLRSFPDFPNPSKTEERKTLERETFFSSFSI